MSVADARARPVASAATHHAVQADGVKVHHLPRDAEFVIALPERVEVLRIVVDTPDDALMIRAARDAPDPTKKPPARAGGNLGCA